MQDTTNNAPRFLRRPEVCARTGLSRSYLFDLEAQGRFPARVKLSERTAAWVESEVSAWIEARIAERDARLAA